jgi:hypothetical protein
MNLKTTSSTTLVVSSYLTTYPVLSEVALPRMPSNVLNDVVASTCPAPTLQSVTEWVIHHDE